MANTDTLTRFLIEHTGVRGVLVSLDETWRDIRARADYPDAVAHLLGEAAAAAALFCGHVKVEGRLSLQLRGTGALRTLFAECTSQGTLRGLARHDGDLPNVLTPRDFGEGSMLAITIETLPPGHREVQRYQGLVGLQEDSLSEALTGYFRQSEQLPTALLLAADGTRAAGLLLQLLPDAERSGDGRADSDGWARVEALFGTLGAAELLAGPDTDLLWRLFHEDGVRLLSEQSLRFACSCSQARVEDMLRGLGETEALAAAETGEARIHCEFCGKEYRLSASDIRGLFAGSTQPNAAGPRGLQ
jgi:molecular chaperone Hsp33